MNIYQMIDILEKNLDDLSYKYPELFDESTFRWQRYELSVDLASFNNSLPFSTDTTMEMFQDILLTTHEMARKFGVIFDEQEKNRKTIL